MVKTDVPMALLPSSDAGPLLPSSDAGPLLPSSDAGPLLPSSDAGLSHRAHGILSYRAHGGLADQMRELSLARALAEATGRTLVLPPLLHHFDQSGPRHYRHASQFALAHARPPLSHLVNVSVLGVHTVDAAELTRLVDADSMPPECGDAAQTSANDESVARWLRTIFSVRYTAAPHRYPERLCMSVVEPPARAPGTGWREAARLAVQSLARRRAEPWLHFDSISHRRGRPSGWETGLDAAPCTVTYRADLLARASAALRPLLSPPFAVAHVRALREAKSKGETRAQWEARLSELASSRTEAGRIRQLYVSTDDADHVLPAAAVLMAPHGVGVVSEANLSLASVLPGLHLDTDTALLALDLAACIGASSFSPAPRSGLSVHLRALRGCASGRGCAPAENRVAWASTGCGGSFSGV